MTRASKKRAQADADRLRDAIEAATNLAMAGRRRLEAATKAVTTAKAADAEAMAEALANGDGGAASPRATRRAREAEIEAGDAVEAARSAVVRLERDLKDAEHEAERAGKDVNAAVAAVLRPTALRMIEEASALRARYLALMYAVSAMVENGLGGGEFTYLRFEISDAEHQQLSTSVGRTWKTVIEALKTNGDAPLPG